VSPLDRHPDEVLPLDPGDADPLDGRALLPDQLPDWPHGPMTRDERDRAAAAVVQLEAARARRAGRRSGCC
jgi:hypothetical protein